MTGIILCAVISGIFTLIITVPFWQTRPRTCYMLMVLIPAICLSGYLWMNGNASIPTDSNADQITKEQQRAFLREEAALKEQLAYRPNAPALITELAGLYIAHERFDDAIALLNNALRQAPAHTDYALQLASAHFAKGLLLAEHQAYEQAELSLYRAQAIAPENAPFLEDIARFITIIEQEKTSQ